MGWWPLTDLWQFNTERELVQRGYHPGEYFYPQNEKQVFEICLGAILTQNTSWLQVEKVLLNLYKNKVLYPEKILFLPDDV